MIRQPTSKASQYEWWRRAVAGERMARVEDEPQCGFYRMRRTRGGPFVPVEIEMIQEICPVTGELTADERLVAFENGRPVDPLTIWTHVRPISAAEYDGLTGARATIPDMADEKQSLELSRMAAIRP